MNRFMHYLVFVNMAANIIASVPKILLEERTNGTILSMVLAVLTGVLLVFFYTRFFNKFPGKDLPQLMKCHLPKWYTYPVLLLIAGLWFLGGLITIITFSFILKRFLTPDMSLLWIVGLFLVFITFGVLMQTKSVLFTLENILLFSFPVIIYMIFKALANDHFYWDFVREAAMYVHKLPSYRAYSASTFLFVGILNLMIFNRVFKKEERKLNWKDLSLVGVVGAAVLCSTYFIPIGIGGFDHIHQLVYPAITTSDSLWMEYGIIERVLYLFLPFFLVVSFLSLLIHWHVAIEVCKNILWFSKLRIKAFNLTPFVYMALFWVITLWLSVRLSEYDLLHFTGYFFNMIPPASIFFIFTFWLITRQAKKSEKQTA